MYVLLSAVGSNWENDLDAGNWLVLGLLISKEVMWYTCSPIWRIIILNINQILSVVFGELAMKLRDNPL